MLSTSTNVTTSSLLLTGSFNNHEDADKAYQATLAKGYTKDDITILLSEKSRTKYFPTDTNQISEATASHGIADNLAQNDTKETKTVQGMGVGSLVGGTIGALAAAVAAVGTSLILPGLGLIVAGPIAAALAGAGAGSLTGGLVGALVGAGIPEDRAKIYESSINSGAIVMTVHAHNAQDMSELETEWLGYNAENIHSQTQA